MLRPLRLVTTTLQTQCVPTIAPVARDRLQKPPRRRCELGLEPQSGCLPSMSQEREAIPPACIYVYPTHRQTATAAILGRNSPEGLLRVVATCTADCSAHATDPQVDVGPPTRGCVYAAPHRCPCAVRAHTPHPNCSRPGRRVASRLPAPPAAIYAARCHRPSTAPSKLRRSDHGSSTTPLDKSHSLAPHR